MTWHSDEGNPQVTWLRSLSTSGRAVHSEQPLGFHWQLLLDHFFFFKEVVISGKIVW